MRKQFMVTRWENVAVPNVPNQLTDAVLNKKVTAVYRILLYQNILSI